MRLRTRTVNTLAIVSAGTVILLGICERWRGARQLVFARQMSEESPSPDGSNSFTQFPGTRWTPSQPDRPFGTNLVARGKEKVDEVLRSNSDLPAKGKQLLAILPRLSEEEKLETIHHVVNLTSDDDYAPLAKMLTNPATPEDIIDVLMADIVSRRNGVKLPLLLEVARAPGHARANEAKFLLGPFLQAGDDWDKCQEKVNLWLKENPDS